MTAIPASARPPVRDRYAGHCARCGMRAPHGHWHHRRSRRVVDQHQHCPCNGVWLCSTCHEWVHGHPAESVTTGFIVSAHQPDPGSVPLYTQWGRRSHDCHGNTKEERDERVQ